MKKVKIKAYKYAELSENAKDDFIIEMYKMPFDYETKENGKIITKYDYFGDWSYLEQIEFCELNEYLFDKYGNIISSLIIEDDKEFPNREIDKFGPEEDYLDEDVQSLVFQIICTLQDDCGYLKPQPISTAGNKQGNGIYNWEAHSEIENICREFNITKRSQK